MASSKEKNVLTRHTTSRQSPGHLLVVLLDQQQYGGATVQKVENGQGPSALIQTLIDFATQMENITQPTYETHQSFGSSSFRNVYPNPEKKMKEQTPRRYQARARNNHTWAAISYTVRNKAGFSSLHGKSNHVAERPLFPQKGGGQRILTNRDEKRYRTETLLDENFESFVGKPTTVFSEELVFPARPGWNGYRASEWLGQCDIT